MPFFFPPPGAIALSYAWFRRRSLWQLATGFAAFNALFLLGFMNFEIAIGMAMWAAAAWIMYRESHPISTIAVACVFTPLVFFFHLFGLCFYALLVGSYEIFVLFERRNQHSLDISFAAKRISALSIPMIVPAILYLASPLEKVSLPPLWKSIPAKVYLAFDSMLELFASASTSLWWPRLSHLLPSALSVTVLVSRKSDSSAARCSLPST